jgi:ACT domain-containing protein
MSEIPMKKQNRFPYQVSVKLDDEAREWSTFLKSKGVDVGELSRQALKEAFEKAAKHFKKSS